MITSLSRRFGIVAICAMAAALWAGPSLAASQSFQVQLTAEQGVQTSGMGTADLTYNPTSHVVTWSISYSGLSSPVTMAHFHDQSGKPVVWLTKRGSKDNPSPIKGRAKLTAAQAKEFEAGNWYINVHTMDNPKGEIRGQVMPPSS
jgi:hypothetical protein